MRRHILSAVLALALPVLASASSVTSAHDALTGTRNGFSLSATSVTHFDFDRTALSAGSLVNDSAATTGNVIIVPEPGTLGLLGTGLIGIAGLLRRKWNKQAPKA